MFLRRHEAGTPAIGSAVVFRWTVAGLSAGVAGVFTLAHSSSTSDTAAGASVATEINAERPRTMFLPRYLWLRSAINRGCPRVKMAQRRNTSISHL
jgi:hypothetical protein